MQGLKSEGGRGSDIGTQHLPEPADQLALCSSAGGQVGQFDLKIWWRIREWEYSRISYKNWVFEMIIENIKVFS